MSDLISRSELLKALSEAEDNYRAEHHDCVMNDDPFSDGILSAMFSVFQIVKSQPTAYSVDKVVEELSNADPQEMMSEEQRNVLNYAIEIVKQGCVYDDVCEWRLCDEEANVYDTSCRNPHILIEGTPRENNYEFCPYCGKKINVVE